MGGPRGEGYSKREMAAELVHLMSALGHDHSAVVCHDRSARVAYRLALDHPHKITRLAVLNIVPTIEEFERMSGGPSLGYWPWYLLAQPAPARGGTGRDLGPACAIPPRRLISQTWRYERNRSTSRVGRMELADLLESLLPVLRLSLKASRRSM